MSAMRRARESYDDAREFGLAVAAVGRASKDGLVAAGAVGGYFHGWD